MGIGEGEEEWSACDARVCRACSGSIECDNGQYARYQQTHAPAHCTHEDLAPGAKSNSAKFRTGGAAFLTQRRWIDRVVLSTAGAVGGMWGPTAPLLSMAALGLARANEQFGPGDGPVRWPAQCSAMLAAADGNSPRIPWRDTGHKALCPVSK